MDSTLRIRNISRIKDENKDNIIKSRKILASEKEKKMNYHCLNKESLEQRKQSAIIGLRNANNAAVSSLFHHTRKGGVGLDLGCGQGGALKKFRYIAQMDGYHAVDLAAESVAECQRRAKSVYPRDSSVMIKQGDLRLEQTWTRFPLGFYDFVYSGFNLHYFSDTDENLSNFIERVSLRLKPGGQWLITTIDWPTLSSYIQNHKENHKGKTWENAICRIEMLGLSTRSYTFTLADRVQKEVEHAVPASTLIRFAARHHLTLTRHVKLNEIRRTDQIGGSMTSDEEDVFALYVAFVFEKDE